MKLIDIRERLITMDVATARNYNGSDSMKEFLDRLANTVEELLKENKVLRDYIGVDDKRWHHK